MEAEVGMIRSEAREYQEPLGAGRGKKRFLPTNFMGIVALSTPWFQISSLQKCKTTDLLSTQLVVLCYCCPQKLTQHHGVSSPWAWLKRFFSTKNTLSSLPAWTLPIHPSHPTNLFQVDFVDSLEEYWLQAGRGRAEDSMWPAREWYCFFQPPISSLFPS